jgi:hypothetical protein
MTARDEAGLLLALLLGAGLDPNAQSRHGPALPHVVDHPEIVAQLLAAGADPNAANEYGNGPLLLAAGRGNVAVVRALLDAGADPNRRGRDGFTPLMQAAFLGRSHDSAAAVAELLARGADPSLRAADGRTALFIAEQEGAANASYALKLLQSEGELIIASTGKDPTTGRLVTQEYRVTDPVMVMMTTTAIELDEELMNRCVVLTVDDGREQTRAIHEKQREAQTLEGVLARHARGEVIKLQQNAQRLLRPMTVVNPFAKELRFADHATRTRRDHMKYLTLINTLTLLHQYQRKVKELEHQGGKIRYIEVTREDIAIADKLAAHVLARGLDELAPQTRRLLILIDQLVTERAKREGIERSDVRFTQRELRDFSNWSATQIKVQLARLVELEYVAVHHRGHRQRGLYELCVSSLGGAPSPFEAKIHAYDSNRSGFPKNRSAENQNQSVTGPASFGPVLSNENETVSQPVRTVGRHVKGEQLNGSSYPYAGRSDKRPDVGRSTPDEAE